MDIFSLELFMAVAYYSSFSIAAEENNISQSSLSKAIIRLENELDVKLFDRKNHPVRLTAAGEQLQNEMLNLLPKFKNAVKLTSAFSEVEKITCCIVSSLMIFDLGEYINIFQNNNSKISIATVIKSSLLSAVNLLKNGNTDFLIAHKSLSDNNMFTETFLHDDLLCAILPKNHPLANRKSVRLEELKNEIWYVSNYNQHIFNDFCKACNFVPDSVRIADSDIKRPHLIIRVAHGNGITMFYQSDIAIYKTDIVATPVIEDVPLTPLVMYETKKLILTENQNVFKKYIIDTLTDLKDTM